MRVINFKIPGFTHDSINQTKLRIGQFNRKYETASKRRHWNTRFALHPGTIPALSAQQTALHSLISHQAFYLICASAHPWRPLVPDVPWSCRGWARVAKVTRTVVTNTDCFRTTQAFVAWSSQWMWNSRTPQGLPAGAPQKMDRQRRTKVSIRSSFGNKSFTKNPVHAPEKKSTNGSIQNAWLSRPGKFGRAWRTTSGTAENLFLSSTQPSLR